MNASDFTDNSLTGIATVMNGRAIITKTLASDFTPEGDESFTFNIKTSAGGPIIATSAPIVVADTSVPTVTPSTTILAEGSAVTFNVSSNQLSSTLYWTLNPISGSITTSDFVGVATTGSFNTDGTGVGSTTLTLANDSTTEGTESFQLQVRTGSTSGSIIATSATVVILDTSLTPPIVSVSPTTTSVNEGSAVTFNVSSNQLSSTLYWTLNPISGSITTSDFVGLSTTGSFNTDGSGVGSTTLTLANDSTTEGTESFQLQVRTGSTSGTISTTSSTITVADTSLTPIVSVTPDSTSLTESSVVTYNVSSNQLSSTLYWTINSVSGTVNASDFSQGATSGSFNTNGSGAGSFVIAMGTDYTTEGTESFQVQVRTGGTGGNIATTSSILTVTDTSPAPTVSVTPSTTSVTEGSSVTFNVSSNQLSSVLFWTITTVSGTIDSSDFSNSITASSFNTDGTGAGSFIIPISSDGVTEGAESFQVQIRRDGVVGTILTTSSTITISESYTVVSGTKAPVFGTNGASPHPPTGWTSQFNSNVDDSNLQIPTLPFNFYINNTAFTAVYIGSNSYITFGSGSSEYSGLSASIPAIPKMMFGASDNSYQRISTFVSGTDYVRVRYEGNASTSGTAGSPGIVAEITLFNPSKFSGNNVIEMLVGVHNRTGGVSNISNASTAYATYTISANQSYVFVGNSTGTSWVVNTGTYVSGAGY
jgi:hypothetical protein